MFSFSLFNDQLLFEAFLAICGVAFLELGEVDGASTAAPGDLLCMAAPLLMGLSWHLLGEHMRTFPQDVMAHG